MSLQCVYRIIGHEQRRSLAIACCTGIVCTDMQLLRCLQQGLGLTGQQEALLLETRHALLSNLGALTAERNALCQQLNVSPAARLPHHLHAQSLCCSHPASQVRAATRRQSVDGSTPSVGILNNPRQTEKPVCRCVQAARTRFRLDISAVRGSEWTQG